MNPTRSPQSLAARHARKIAGALAKGRAPKRTPELDDFLEDSEAVFETLDEFADCLSTDQEPELAQAYLFLLQGQLESLRLQQDRRFDAAIGRIENFQRAVVGHVRAGRIDGLGLSLIGSAMHQAGLATSGDLQAAMAESIEQDPQAQFAEGIVELLDNIVEACGGNPFDIVASLSESAHGMPVEVLGNVAAGLSDSVNATAREAAVLMLLHPEQAIRASAVAALSKVPASISPRSVRRLIAMRNWRPEDERSAVDAVVRSARAHGVDCASWESGQAGDAMASAIDGSTAQTILVVIPEGRRKRLASMLFKHGLSDVSVGPPMTERDLRAVLSQAVGEVGLLPVSRAYLDRVVRSGIQVAVDQGRCAPAGLLEAAELAGGADWQPARADWRELLAELLDAVAPERRSPTAVSEVLRTSDEWGSVPTSDSWFEGDQEAARIVRRGGRRTPEKQVAHVVQSVIAPRRDKWAELFVGTALWLRESTRNDVPWQEFATLADAIAKGHDLTQISLMQVIAVNTVLALADAG